MSRHVSNVELFSLKRPSKADVGSNTTNTTNDSFVGSNTPDVGSNKTTVGSNNSQQTTNTTVGSNSPVTVRVQRSKQRRELGQINAAVPLEVLEKFRRYARRSGRPMVDLLEQAMYKMMAENPLDVATVGSNNREVGSVGSNVSKMIDDVVEACNSGDTLNIISHQFLLLRKRSLSQSDLDATRKFIADCHREGKQIDEAAARGGIAVGLFRTRQKQINSAKYFFNTILELLDLPAGPTREEYADHAIRKLRQKQSLEGK